VKVNRDGVLKDKKIDIISVGCAHSLALSFETNEIFSWVK
jgi:hypothetical protein